MSINFGLSTNILLVLNPCSVLLVLVFASPLYRKPVVGKNKLVLLRLCATSCLLALLHKSNSSRKKKMIPATALFVLSWWFQVQFFFKSRKLLLPTMLLRLRGACKMRKNIHIYFKYVWITSVLPNNDTKTKCLQKIHAKNVCCAFHKRKYYHFINRPNKISVPS